MIKLLHSADWHLDAPLRGFDPGQRELLRRESLLLPDRIVDLALREGCDMMLLCGDLFDGQCTAGSIRAVSRALERANMPVFIAPGNHDPYGPDSPWVRELWPGNVHIFSRQAITSVVVEELDCRVYGGAFVGMDCPGLLRGFQAGGTERYAVLALHGDPTGADSPYCPVTAAQVRESGLDYAALGHIHAPGRMEGDAAQCAWPGCPMGRGFDETGTRGVLLVELEERAQLRFCPLDGPRFYDWTVPVGDDPEESVRQILRDCRREDFIRLRLTGEAEPERMAQLAGIFTAYPNLTVTDDTVSVQDLWENAREDSLEGIYFGILHDATRGQDADTVRALELAAKISRQILNGWEVELP